MKNPGETSEAVSVMHTADIAKSDINLAGLSLRCGQIGVEVLIIVTVPMARSTTPSVVLTAGHHETKLQARIAPNGEALILPQSAAALAFGDWLKAAELTIEIGTNPSPIKGVVPISEMADALRALPAKCR